jgi:hypothetical protein
MRTATLVVCIAMTTASLLASACSSSSSGGGGTGGVQAIGGGGGVAGMAGATTGGAAGKGGTGTGGAAGDGNDTMETATPITVGTTKQASLDPAATDLDWYSFDGTEGQAIFIATSAKSGVDPFDPTFLDLVISLHDSTGKQIALQDDPEPRTTNDPFLMTVLPTTGKYFLRVMECTAWEKGGSANCAPAAAITNKNYAVLIDLLDFTKDGTVKEIEPNDVADDATPITYSPNPNQPTGVYYLSTLHGGFSAAADVDGFSFTLPADLAVDADSRAVARFYPQPSGPEGNGSTATLSEVTIVAQADPTTVIAKANVPTGATLTVPLEIGTPYVIFYTRTAAPSGAYDFYFDLMGMGGGNPVETQETENDDLATAELLTASATAYGTSYFIEGDLGTGDVDHFSAAVPVTNADEVSVACGAERSGSGLRGLTATLLDGTGAQIATATEAADKDLLISSVAVPAGKSFLVLKLDATTQASDVTSSFYRCGVHFRAPAP